MTKQGEWSFGGLPRSAEGVTKPQLRILQEALKTSKAQNVLCSHFTFVNYSTTRPIGELGKVSSSDSYGLHDYGTFENNRDAVYSLVNEKIQYTLSGHSHRSGLYQFASGKKLVRILASLSWGWNVSGQAAKDGKFQPSDGVRLLVAASGGPIPVQNHDNELYNWGLDRPSGNYIKFSGSSEAEVGIKTAATPQTCLLGSLL